MLQSNARGGLTQLYALAELRCIKPSVVAVLGTGAVIPQEQAGLRSELGNAFTLFSARPTFPSLHGDLGSLLSTKQLSRDVFRPAVLTGVSHVRQSQVQVRAA